MDVYKPFLGYCICWWNHVSFLIILQWHFKSYCSAQLIFLDVTLSDFPWNVFGFFLKFRFMIISVYMKCTAFWCFLLKNMGLVSVCYEFTLDLLMGPLSRTVVWCRPVFVLAACSPIPCIFQKTHVDTFFSVVIYMPHCCDMQTNIDAM